MEIGFPGGQAEIGKGFFPERRVRVRTAEKRFVNAAAPFDAREEPVAVEYERRKPNQPKVNIIHDRHNAAGQGLFITPALSMSDAERRSATAFVRETVCWAKERADTVVMGPRPVTLLKNCGLVANPRLVAGDEHAAARIAGHTSGTWEGFAG